MDIRTLFLVSAAISLLLAILSTLVWREVRERPGLGPGLGRAAAARWLFVLGMLALALRGVVPRGAAAIGSLMLLIGLALLIDGTRRYFASAPVRGLSWGLIGLATLNLLVIYLQPTPEPPNLFGNGAVAALYAVGAWTAARQGRGDAGARLIALGFGLESAVFLARLVAVIAGQRWETASGLAPHWPTALVIATGALCGILVTFGFLLSVGWRVRSSEQEARAELETREQRLAALLGAIPDILLRIDRTGKIVFAKEPRGLKVALPAQEVLGRNVRDLFPRLAPRILEQIEIALATGEVEEHGYAIVVDGEERQREARLMRCGTDEVVIIARDVTQRLQHEQTIRQQNQLLEGLVEVARATSEGPDLATTLRKTLDVSMALTGAEGSSLLLLDERGGLIDRFDSAGEVARLTAPAASMVIDQGLAGQVVRTRRPELVPDTQREPRWVELPSQERPARSALVVPIASGTKVVGVLTLVHSEPSRFVPGHLQLLESAGAQIALALRNAQVSDARRRLVEELEDLVERLRLSERQAHEAREAAVRADAEKSLFLANVSHEIRTPLNAVVGMASLLASTPLSTDQLEAVTTIRSAGDALLAVISDVLDLSKIEAGALELFEEAFDAPELVRQGTRIFAAMAATKGLHLHTEIAPEVPAVLVGDERRLRQVLINLVGNALKFTAQGEVGVSLSGEPLEGGTYLLCLTVRDTGVGIRAEHLARLFKPFSQVDASPTRRFAGAGLGLAISHRLIEKMGGRIDVQSHAGEGSVFTVRVPLRQTAPQPAHVEPAADAPPVAGLHVLVAEDNELNQLVAARLLERLGCTHVVVGNGLEAIAALERESFDVVLMDVQMPELDGLEATRRIRARWPERKLRIIGLSASALDQDRERGEEAGMNAYLSKPIWLEQLSAVLAQSPPASSG